MDQAAKGLFAVPPADLADSPVDTVSDSTGGNSGGGYRSRCPDTNCTASESQTHGPQAGGGGRRSATYKKSGGWGQNLTGAYPALRLFFVEPDFNGSPDLPTPI